MITKVSAASHGAGHDFRVSTRRLVGSLFLAGVFGLAPALRAQSAPYAFTTIAGVAAKTGSTDGTGGGANLPLFYQPIGLAINSAGNFYVADAGNQLVRMVTPAGVVTTLAGSPGVDTEVDGTGSGASFSSPQGPSVDSAGNVYIADYNGDTIRKITPAGVVTTLAGLAFTAGTTNGTGALALFFHPSATAVDSAGNVYVTDSGNSTIRKITSAGVVTTFAGTVDAPGTLDGTGLAAQFNNPRGLVIDSAGNLYVVDSNSDTIRKITPAGVVTTFAGTANAYGSADGTGASARFNFPIGLTIDGSGNLYVADQNNQIVRKVTPAGIVTTLAGSPGVSGEVDGTGSAALFNRPTGVAVDGSGNVYVTDYNNSLIRVISPAGVVTTVAGVGGATGFLDGTGYRLDAALLWNPNAVTISGGQAYVADTGNNVIRQIAANGAVVTIAGNAVGTGITDGTGSSALFNSPSGIAGDSAGNLYVADTGNHLIRKVTTAGVVTTFAGTALVAGSADGMGTNASFNFPSGVAVDAAGSVYVADYSNHTIRKITPDGTVTTFAGTAGVAGSANGAGNTATFNFPRALAVDTSGNVYVADSSNNLIRKITAGGFVTTLAGTAGSSGTTDGAGSAARFDGPAGIAVDGNGNVFVSDSNNSTIREITPAGVVTTIGGAGGTVGSVDGIGPAARFNHPAGLALDGAGNLYIADNRNQTIRLGLATGNALGGAIGEGGTGTSTGSSTGLTGGGSTSSGTGGSTGTGSGSGTGTSTSNASTAFLLHPSGMTADTVGYEVADTANNCIKLILADGTGATSILAGKEGTSGSSDGTGLDARFNGPTGITTDAVGDYYVCDTGNATIRKVTSLGVVTTLAGSAGKRGTTDGTGSAALFNSPSGIAYDNVTSNLYVTDSVSDTIRMVTLAGVVTTYAGQAKTVGEKDGLVASALFNNPVGITIDSAQNLFIADTFNHTIRKINIPDILVAVIDPTTGAQAVDSSGNAETTVKTPAGTVTTLAGAPGVSGIYDGTGQFALFNLPQGVSVDALDNVYVADTGNSCIRVVTSRGTVITVAGIAGLTGNRDGAGSTALFNQPQGVYVSGSVLVVDTGNSVIRSVGLTDQVVNTLTLKASTAAAATATTIDPVTGLPVSGGGAPSDWFLGALVALAAIRLWTNRRRKHVAA